MIKVSHFSAEDACLAYAIFKTARPNPWSYDTFKKTAMNGISLVAKENGIVAGYILLTSVLDEFTLEDITVSTSFRKKGIGSKLMYAALDLAVELKQSAIFLEVRYSNKPALDLYGSMGFELVGERKNYYDAAVDVDKGEHSPREGSDIPSRENAYIMKKVL